MLDIDIRFRQGVLFIKLKGILNGDTCTNLENSLSTLIEDNGIKYVLFNLSQLNYIDKYGISILIKNYLIISHNNGKFIVCGLDKIFNYNTNIIDNLYQINDEEKVFELVNL